ncbi:MAG: hypothetical protein SW127_05270 [Actinomycetota bacterium]|nr:hypothetical protein [Actinomycetota bacterium]
MTALFGGRQRRRDHEPTLSELPAWGLEIMMGLYGPETIQRERAQEEVSGIRVSDPDQRPGSDVNDAHPEPARDERVDPGAAAVAPSPLVVELEAMNELVKYFERKFKRH